MTTPVWALTLAFWAHMAATVVWIGALAAMGLLILPMAHRFLSAGDYVQLIEQIQRRLDPVAWFCLATLIATGLIQMSANPNYEGLLTIQNPWAFAILAKHAVFAGMVGISAVMTWKTLPELRHLALRRARGLELKGADAHHGRELLLLRLNLLLSVVVLALTAVARTA